MACSILHVLYWLRAEGTPRLALEMLREEQRQTGEMGQVALHCRDSMDLEPAFAALGVTIHDMPWPRRRFDKLFVAALRLLRRTRPRGVVCYSLGAHVMVAAAARMLGIPCVVHLGNAPPDEPGQLRKLRLQLQAGQPFVTRHLACSEFVRRECIRAYGMRPGAVVTVPNGIDLRRFLAARPARGPGWTPAANRPLVIGMVASMEVHKDQDTLLHALVELRRAGVTARLRLVGSGTREPELRRLANELGVNSSIDWVGTVSEVIPELHRMDVFAYSVHDQEGLGIALVEALAAGLPAVGADVGACREVLQGGRLGPLVAPRAAAAWASSLISAAAGQAVPAEALDEYNIRTTFRHYWSELTSGPG